MVYHILVSFYHLLSHLIMSKKYQLGPWKQLLKLNDLFIKQSQYQSIEFQKFSVPLFLFHILYQ
jgi:hypothetical protein